MNRLLLLLLSIPVALPAVAPAHAQRPEDVGAGVINFLLRNPRTADRMRPDERIALDIIADLLRTEGERQHELAYAQSTRSQITINTTDGRQAQFVRNTAGAVFLLLDGVIYPIAPELVNQAVAVGGRREQPATEGTPGDVGGRRELPVTDGLPQGELERSAAFCESLYSELAQEDRCLSYQAERLREAQRQGLFARPVPASVRSRCERLFGNDRAAFWGCVAVALRVPPSN